MGAAIVADRLRAFLGIVVGAAWGAGMAWSGRLGLGNCTGSNRGSFHRVGSARLVYTATAHVENQKALPESSRNSHVSSFSFLGIRSGTDVIKLMV